MSRTLVIHVGAQKCASSSLQASLRLAHQALNGHFGFCFLNPAQLRSADLALAERQPIADAFAYIDQVLARQTADQVVISHEMLGNRPVLVGAIAERAIATFSFDRVVISGYTRLQSSYHISAFSQWFFRDRKRLTSDIKVFQELGLPWRKFTAQERHLFALSYSGRDRNWFSNYKRFCSEVSHLSGRVEVVSCHIPTRHLPYSLLRHFLESTGLNFEHEDLESMDVRKNQSFDPIVIQGVSNFSSELPLRRQSFFPGPHEGNRWLFRVCDRVVDREDLTREFEDLFSPSFQQNLVNHIDSRTAKSNIEYCQLMSVDPRYFEPEPGALERASDELVDFASQVALKRKMKLIMAYNRAVEDEFFRAARLEIVST